MSDTQPPEKTRQQMVFDACDVIWGEQRWPGYQEVRTKVGGGSDQVRRALEEWTEAKMAQLVELEAGIPKVFYDAYKIIDKQAGKEAARRFETERNEVITKAAADIADAASREEQARAKVQALEYELAELQRRVTTADDQCNALNGQLSAERNKVVHLESTLAAQDSVHRAQEQKYQSEIVELKASVQNTLTAARDDKARDDKRYTALEAHIAAQLADLNAQLQHSAQQVVKNAELAEDWRSKHEQLSLQCESLKRDLGSAHMRVEMLTTESLRHQSALNEANGKLSAAQEREARQQGTFDSHVATIAALRQELTAAQLLLKDTQRWQVEAETLRAVLTAQQSAASARNKHN